MSRFFFAVLPDRNTAVRLLQPPHICSGQPVLPEDCHLTLCFLGAHSAARLPELLQIGAAQRAKAHTADFEAYEYWSAPRVVVATCKNPPAELRLLAEGLRRESERFGLSPAAGDWHPHVTVMKKVSQVSVLQTNSAITCEFASFSLMQSNIDGARSAYTVLRTWPLLYKACASGKSLRFRLIRDKYSTKNVK